SLLVYLQKKPDLKISSSLVDLDDLLDRTQDEHRNAIVTALQPDNLVLLRYKDGQAVACYHGLSFRKAQHADSREDFLVKVYTMSTHSTFEINLFTDLVVTHSEDARHIPQDFQGTIASFFVSQPPKLVVRLKDRPLKTYTFTGKQLTIGRLPENDIVIDNLGVSRQHAVIHSWKSGYHVKDLGSKNSTFLNGQKIDSAELKNGDVITIGKYQILFQILTGEPGTAQTMDQTMIIPGFRSGPQMDFPGADAGAGAGLGGSASAGGSFGAGGRGGSGNRGGSCGAGGNPGTPRLYRRSDNEEFVLDKDRTVIGRGKDTDIRLGGLFAPRVTVEISRTGDDFTLQKTGGHRDVNINGESMAEKVLEEEDLIAIGSEEFVFKR
ncbi:MAG: FHA domain-containing protein, partial [Dehalococcoidia bacterium]